MTSIVGRQIVLKRGPDGRVRMERRLSYVARNKKLKIDRLVKAWKAKGKP